MSRMNQFKPQSRLCHVITTPQDQFSTGLNTRLGAEIARDLGIEVEVTTGWGINDVNNVSSPLPGVIYHRLPCLTKYIHPQQDIKTLFDLIRLFRQKQYRAVQTHNAKAGVLGRLAAALTGVPLVVHEIAGYGFPPSHSSTRQMLYSFAERLAGHFTTHYIFYAAHLRDTFNTLGIGPNAIKKVIYPGMDLSSFLSTPSLSAEAKADLKTPWKIAAEDKVVGYVARMVPSKGHHFLIQAFKHLTRELPKVKLLLVGGAIWPEECEYMQKMKDLTTKLGLTDKVVFCEHQSDILPFYQMFDVLALPSLYEGVANVMLEALSIGLPIVAFDIPVVKELAPQDTIVSPVGDVVSLSRGLARLLSDNSCREKSTPSLAFRKSLVDKFSPSQWRKNLAAFYNEIGFISVKNTI